MTFFSPERRSGRLNGFAARTGVGAAGVAGRNELLGAFDVGVAAKGSKHDLDREHAPEEMGQGSPPDATAYAAPEEIRDCVLLEAMPMLEHRFVQHARSALHRRVGGGGPLVGERDRAVELVDRRFQVLRAVFAESLVEDGFSRRGKIRERLVEAPEALE